ncbi:MAG: TrkH family potassium uptake protein [Methanobacteriaceae archaeon]|nr:TrkH family potassium uptake protein [Methanobacteriaceae archaeon]
MSKITDVSRNELYTVLRYIGKVCKLLAIAMIIPVIISFIYNEEGYTIPFLFTAGITYLIGFLLEKYFISETKLSTKSAMIFSTVIWLVVCALSALPYFLTSELSYLDSFFEAMSGFTTTGYSMYSDLELVSYTIHFWRGLTQWLGGLGIVFIALAVINSIKNNVNLLYLSEGREERIFPSIRKTTRVIFYIYTGASIIGIILYVIAGMPVFDAIFHTFSAISTGGAAMHNNSLLYYNNFYIECVAMALMIFGATNFLLIYEVLMGNWKAYFKDIETKVFLPCVLISILLILLMLWGYDAFGSNILVNLRYDIFQVFSAITTTGLQTTFNPALSIKWGSIGMVLLTLLMVIGGGSGSTAGGLKWLRIGVLTKSIFWEVKSYILPKNTIVKQEIHHIKNIKVSNEQLRITGIFVYTYIVMFILSVVICLLFYDNILDIMFDVASSLSNVGLSSGIISNTSPVEIKLLFILNFWIGRLEIWPALVLIGLIIKKITSIKKE